MGESPAGVRRDARFQDRPGPARRARRTFAMPHTRRTPPRASARGFTLIEVLVTLVILSTGIVLVLQAFETSAAALGEARRATRAMMLIESKLAEIEAEDEGAKAASGNFERPYESFRYRIEVKSAGGGRDAGYEKVVVTVWQEQTEVQYAVSTLQRKF